MESTLADLRDADVPTGGVILTAVTTEGRMKVSSTDADVTDPPGRDVATII